MRATGNKGHVCSRLRKCGSERSADTAGADNGYFHLNSPVSAFNDLQPSRQICIALTTRAL